MPCDSVLMEINSQIGVLLWLSCWLAESSSRPGLDVGSTFPYGHKVKMLVHTAHDIVLYKVLNFRSILLFLFQKMGE